MEMDIKRRAEAAAATARQVAQKAADANRAMTPEEQRTYDDSMSELHGLLETAKLRKQSSVNWGSLDDARALGTGHGKADTSRRLSFKNMGSGIANRMLSGDLGAKALAPSGAALVGQAFTQDPVALGRVATGLLDVLPVQVQTSPSYAYLAQTTRTNSAAVVAEGALKPVSVLGLTRVEKQLAVIAHVSESFNRMYLLDTNGAIEVFVNTELEWGLGRAVEAKVIADINATSGIQLQSYSTSPLQTLRKSITKLEIAGYAAGAIALHPSDFETIELQLSSVNSVERQGLPYDPARRTLYGVPVATTTSASAGIGHVLAAGAVVVDTDSQGVQFQWSENAGAETFQRNEIVARCEGRYGTSVLSPLGVVKATLTGGGGGGSTAA